MKGTLSTMAPKGRTAGRFIGVLAASAALCTAVAPAATAADLPEGLYGTADPQYDGVWRQSIALLAQDTMGLVPAKPAVDWLSSQQCADGGFTPYRADAAKACDAKLEDTNATGAAVQALAALGGHEEAVAKAEAWLKKAESKDGGWAFMPGDPADANSTATVLGALAAAGQQPSGEALAPFQLDCKTAKKPAERGAYAYQPEKNGDLFANDYATAAAALAAQGTGLLVKPATADKPIAEPKCEGDKLAGEPAEAAAWYLSQRFASDKPYLLGPDGKAPDANGTAVALLALAAGGHTEATTEAYAWLEKNSAGWSKNNPAALGTLVLTTHALGKDPASFGGTDLLTQLNATGPKPSTANEEVPKKDTKADSDDDSSSATVWAIIAVGVVAGVGGGLIISLRKRKQQP